MESSHRLGQERNENRVIRSLYSCKTECHFATRALAFLTIEGGDFSQRPLGPVQTHRMNFRLPVLERLASVPITLPFEGPRFRPSHARR